MHDLVDSIILFPDVYTSREHEAYAHCVDPYFEFWPSGGRVEQRIRQLNENTNED